METMPNKFPIPQPELTQMANRYHTGAQELNALRLGPAIENKLSLAGSTLRAHGAAAGGPTIYVNNNCGAAIQNKTLTAFDIVPEPAQVAALTSYSAATLRSGEFTLSLPLPEGFANYYVRRGLLETEQQILEVNPLPRGLGFPHLDPLAALDAQGLELPEELKNAKIVFTFPSNLARQQARAAGADPIQDSDPHSTNNKALLREMAPAYGFTMSPGIKVTSPESVTAALEAFSHAPRLWFKLSHGAGGDTVIPVDAPVTKEKALNAIQKLRGEVDKAFASNQYDKEAHENFWAKDSFTPSGTSIIIEADAGVLGQVTDNCAAMVILNKDGQSTIVTYTRQITKDGAYLGNESLTHEAVLKEKVDSMLKSVANFYHHELGYAGIFGVDYLVVRNSKGEEHPIVIEANGRPINSSYAHIVAEKIGATHWINAKLKLPVAMSSFNQVAPLLTDENGLALHEQSDPDLGCVIPTFLDSIQIKKPDGTVEVIHPGKNLRLVIASNQGIEHCREILAKLSQKCML